MFRPYAERHSVTESTSRLMRTLYGDDWQLEDAPTDEEERAGARLRALAALRLDQLERLERGPEVAP